MVGVGRGTVGLGRGTVGSGRGGIIGGGTFVGFRLYIGTVHGDRGTGVVAVDRGNIGLRSAHGHGQAGEEGYNLKKKVLQPLNYFVIFVILIFFLSSLKNL